MDEILKTKLEGVRDELRRSLATRGSDIHIQPTADDLDMISQRLMREQALDGMDRSAQTLRRVLAALQRLNAGAYGECVMCSEEIQPKRLAALPWAERCLVCQEAADRMAAEDKVIAKEEEVA